MVQLPSQSVIPISSYLQKMTKLWSLVTLHMKKVKLGSKVTLNKNDQTNVMVQLLSPYAIPISSYEPKTTKTLIVHNSATEGRTGVIQMTFLIIRYLWYPKTRLKIAKNEKKNQLLLPKVKKVKLGSRVKMTQGSPESRSQLKLTFRSRFMKENVLLDP